MTQNEIRLIACNTYLNRDSVRDEIASIDCYLRTHDQCFIHSTSPVFDLARVLDSLGSKSVFAAGSSFSISIYGLASIHGLADSYINSYLSIERSATYWDEYYNLRNARNVDTDNAEKKEDNTNEPVNNRCAVSRAFNRISSSLVRILTRIGVWLHIFPD